jgi:hypothetical protein
MATAAELLTLVDAAICARLSGGAVASYSIGNRNLTYMSLNDLCDFRRDLQAEVQAGLAESAGGGLHTYADFEPNG